jgi:hypothetical protein
LNDIIAERGQRPAVFTKSVKRPAEIKPSGGGSFLTRDDPFKQGRSAPVITLFPRSLCFRKRGAGILTRGSSFFTRRAAAAASSRLFYPGKGNGAGNDNIVN